MAYPIAKRIIPPIYKLWLRKVEGVENLPKKGPYIIAANHTSYYDALLLPSIIVQKFNIEMCSLIDSTYWKYTLLKYFLHKWGGIPVHVNREKDANEYNRKAIEIALDYLKNERVLMIFPEGARSKDGKLRKAYNGIAEIALKSKVPVVPAGIIGAHKVWPKDRRFPTFNRCEVKIGKIMNFEKYYNQKVNEKILKEITRQVMRQIAKLIGQEYNY